MQKKKSTKRRKDETSTMHPTLLTTLSTPLSTSLSTIAVVDKEELSGKADMVRNKSLLLFRIVQSLKEFEE